MLFLCYTMLCRLCYTMLSRSGMYNYFNTKRIKHRTRLRLGLSNLHDYKLKDGLLDWQNPICSCGFKQPIKTTCHLLHYTNSINEITLTLNEVLRITKDKLASCDTAFAKRRVYCDEFYLVTNTRILYEYIDFIFLSKRFDRLLLQKRFKSFVKL